MASAPNALSSVQLTKLTVTFEAQCEALGPCPDLIRTYYTTAGGTVRGPELYGAVRPRGWERCAVRADGVVDHETRFTLELKGGALVAITGSGLSTTDEYGYDAFLRAQPPASIAVAMHCRLNTSAPKYLWLNKLFVVGLGIRYFHNATLELTLCALAPPRLPPSRQLNAPPF